MDPKPRPNHRVYIEILRRMTPDEKLRKVFELSSFTKQLFIHGLRKKNSELSETEFAQLLKNRLEKCHNRNY